MYYRNVAFDIYSILFDSNNVLVTGTTIADGDATFSIDGSTFAPLGTTPTVTPAGGGQVKSSVSAVENTGTSGQLILSDLVGGAWEPVSFFWKNDPSILDSGTSQAGGATSITLRASASAVNDYYNGGVIEIIGGTGVGQSRQITDYVGSSREATVSAWATQPDSSSIYIIHPAALVLTAAQVNTEATNALNTYDPPTSAELVSEINDVQADIEGIATGTAAEVWGYPTRTLTQSAAQVAAVMVGSNISVVRGTTWVIPITGLGNLTNYNTVYMTVKKDKSQSDKVAIMQVYNDASGLIRFNGDAPQSAAGGKIVIDNTVLGNVTVTIQADETVNSSVFEDYYYDFKGIDDDGNVDPLPSGLFEVTGDVTRAVTSP